MISLSLCSFHSALQKQHCSHCESVPESNHSKCATWRPFEVTAEVVHFTTQFAHSNTRVHTHTQMASSSRISGLTDSPNNSLKTASCLRERRMWLAHSDHSHQEAVAHGKPPSETVYQKKIQNPRTASHAFRPPTSTIMHRVINVALSNINHCVL